MTTVTLDGPEMHRLTAFRPSSARTRPHLNAVLSLPNSALQLTNTSLRLAFAAER